MGRDIIWKILQESMYFGHIYNDSLPYSLLACVFTKVWKTEHVNIGRESFLQNGRVLQIYYCSPTAAGVPQLPVDRWREERWGGRGLSRFHWSSSSRWSNHQKQTNWAGRKRITKSYSQGKLINFCLLSGNFTCRFLFVLLQHKIGFIMPYTVQYNSANPHSIRQ